MGTGTASKGMQELELREPLSRALGSVSLEAVPAERCLTRVPEGGEGRGADLGVRSLGQASLCHAETLLEFMSRICHLVAPGTIAERPTRPQRPQQGHGTRSAWHPHGISAAEGKPGALLLLLYSREPQKPAVPVVTVTMEQRGLENRSVFPGHESNFCAVTPWGEPGKHRSVSVVQQWSFSEALRLLFGLAKEPTCFSPALAPHLTLCHQPDLSATKGVSRLHVATGDCQRRKGQWGCRRGRAWGRASWAATPGECSL